MKCDEARFAVSANPGDAAAELAAHLQSCRACREFAEEMRSLDARLRVAMRVGVPDIPLPAESGPVRTVAPRRWFAQPLAMAASLAGIVVLAGALWIGIPRQSLASAVVGHMSHEPESWTRTETLSSNSVGQVLARSGLALRAQLPGVTYANSCWFRGRNVPHLVVLTDAGPVTVMVLPQERVDARTGFADGEYRGVLVPAPRGALAILTRDAANVDAVASKALAAIDFAD